MVVGPVVMMVVWHMGHVVVVGIFFWLDDVVHNDVKDQSADNDAANDVKANGAGACKVLEECFRYAVAGLGGHACH